MSNLTTLLLGHSLAHPIVVSSGPLTHDAAAIRRCLEAGAAGAVTKTISLTAAVNPAPHLGRATVAGSLLNTEKWSDLDAETWCRQELPALRGCEGLVIASLGHTAADARALAGRLAAAGAEMLEAVSYRAEDMAELVLAARGESGLPVLAKVSANWPDLLQTVEACLAAGADGITAIDSVGPALSIDVETRRPVLGPAWLSGAAIKPFAVHAVAAIARRFPGVPVLGVGGISTATDVIEMLLAGATAVQVHSVLLLRGLEHLGRLVDGVDRWLAEHQVAAPAELVGCALPYLGGPESTNPLAIHHEPVRCTACGACVRACAYGARALVGKEMMFREAECHSCGLCVSVCPKGALGLSQ